MSLSNEVKTDKRKSIFKKIIFSLFIVGCFYLGYQYFFNKPIVNNELTKKVFNVKNGDLKTYIESDGKVTLKDDLSLDFQINGIIKKIYKNEGDSVKKGELIAELDDSYLNIDIQKAKLALEVAKSNYEIKKRGSSPDEITIQNTLVETNKTSLNNTKIQGENDLQSSIENQNNLNLNLENVKKQNEINILNSQNVLNTADFDLKTGKNTLNSTIVIEDEKYKNNNNKLVMEAGQIISQIEKNLYDIDLFLGVTDGNKHLNDSFEIYIGAKNPQTKTQAENSFIENKKAFDDFYNEWKNYKQTNDLTKLNEYSLKLKNIGTGLNKTLNYTLDVLKNSISTSTFTQTIIDNYITTFEKSLSDNKDNISSFTTLIETLSESKTLSDEKIETLKSQIISLEQKLKTYQTNYEKTLLENDISLSLANQKLDQSIQEVENIKLKNNSLISKETSNLDISKTLLDSKKQVDSLELEPFITSINIAQKNLEEAQKKLQDSKLYSPVSGKIVDISGKNSELTNNLKSPFITIINPSIMYVESYVEEGDIVKIKENQNVYLSFDSIDGLSLTGKVVYINDKANIDSNSVVSYEVKIIFDVNDNRVKDGMSTTIEFITKEIKNALIIPVQAVKTINKKPSVMLENGEYKEVITGFTDGKMVELINGLKLGDKVIY